MEEFIDIKPIPVTRPSMTKIQIKILDYKLFSTTAIAEIRFYDADESFVENRFLDIPASVISEWGTDDTIVETYIMAQLNIEKA